MTRLLLSLLLAAGTAGAAVYIDPTAPCPGAGTAEAPYCAWSSVTTWQGGEQYLQRRGTEYVGQVRVITRTAPDELLTIGAYGEGARPVIDLRAAVEGWDVAANWRHMGGEVWRLPVAHYQALSVLRLDGVRAVGPAASAAAVCTTPGSVRLAWHATTTDLTVCAPSNPAGLYVTVEGNHLPTSKSPWTPFALFSQRNVLIEGMDIRGGTGGLEVRDASSDITIRGNTLGLYAPSGLRLYSAGTPVTRVVVDGNLIDSGIRWGDARQYNWAISGEGVHFNHRVTQSVIARNEVVAWPHNGIYLDGHLPDSQVTDNIIEGNDIHCGPQSAYFDYCRPLGIDGNDGGASRNIVTRNVWHDFTVAPQINGNDNLIVGNVCRGAYDGAPTSRSVAQCLALQGYVQSTGNTFLQNHFSGTHGYAIKILSGTAGQPGHRFIGNVIECSQCLDISADASIGPMVWQGNSFRQVAGQRQTYLYRSATAAGFSDIAVPAVDWWHSNDDGR